MLVFWFWREIVFVVTYVLSVQYSCAVVSVFCYCGKVNCKHRQSHIDFLKNDYSVSLFSRNNALAKTYFSWNPNVLLLHISFFVSINQHCYNHDRFSKISRFFCGNRNWWIIIVFFKDNSVKFTILSQKISRPFPTFPLWSFLKNIKNILCKWKIMNNHIIPLTHTVREITNLSD